MNGLLFFYHLVRELPFAMIYFLFSVFYFLKTAVFPIYTNRRLLVPCSILQQVLGALQAGDHIVDGLLVLHA